MADGKLIYRRFGESYCLHVQDHVVQEELYLKTFPGVNREGETFSSYCVGPDFVSTYLTAHLLICNELGYPNEWPARYHSDRFILAD